MPQPATQCLIATSQLQLFAREIRLCTRRWSWHSRGFASTASCIHVNSIPIKHTHYQQSRTSSPHTRVLEHAPRCLRQRLTFLTHSTRTCISRGWQGVLCCSTLTCALLCRLAATRASRLLCTRTRAVRGLAAAAGCWWWCGSGRHSCLDDLTRLSE